VIQSVFHFACAPPTVLGENLDCGGLSTHTHRAVSLLATFSYLLYIFNVFAVKPTQRDGQYETRIQRHGSAATLAAAALQPRAMRPYIYGEQLRLALRVCYAAAKSASTCRSLGIP